MSVLEDKVEPVYRGPDPDATHEARITLGGETVLVRVRVGDKFCLQSLMHKDAAALAGWLGPARWVATAAEPVTRKAEPLARPSRIEGGTLHGPFPTDVPGRYELTLDRESSEYLRTYADRVNATPSDEEEEEQDPGRSVAVGMIAQASLIREARSRNSDPEVELERLRCAVESATGSWSNPNALAVGKVRTTIKRAATLIIEELREAGYAANFVMNEPDVVVFALDPADAPDPEKIDGLFGP